MSFAYVKSLMIQPAVRFIWVRVYVYIINKYTFSIYIHSILALEYMEGGEIIWRQDDESNIPVLSMSEARDIFRDVVSGLDYRK